MSQFIFIALALFVGIILTITLALMGVHAYISSKPRKEQKRLIDFINESKFHNNKS